MVRNYYLWEDLEKWKAEMKAEGHKPCEKPEVDEAYGRILRETFEEWKAENIALGSTPWALEIYEMQKNQLEDGAWREYYGSEEFEKQREEERKRKAEEYKAGEEKVRGLVTSLLEDIADNLYPIYGERPSLRRVDGVFYPNGLYSSWQYVILPERFLGLRIPFISKEKAICGIQEATNENFDYKIIGMGVFEVNEGVPITDSSKHREGRYINVLIIDKKAEEVVRGHVDTFAQERGIPYVNYHRRDNMPSRL